MGDELKKRKLHDEVVRLKLAKLAALEHEISLRERLPHRYAMKFFPWQKEWFDCKEKVQCLTAANQVGKSSTMMRKTIEWAVNKELWPELWPVLSKQGIIPRSFWYLYPTREMASSEFNDKWRPMLPKQDDAEYGWTFFKNDKSSPMLVFNSGVTVHFKTYSQGAELLQAGSCAFIACFVDGTKVLSEDGYVDIETIRVGTKVLTRSGLKDVVSTKNRSAEVVTAYFSDGTRIEATPDHRFFTTNRGWVELKDLTHSDQLVGHPSWQNYEISGNIWNLFYSMVSFIADILTPRIFGKKTILLGSKNIVGLMLSICTKLFIAPLQNLIQYLMGIMSTTMISILSIMRFQTWFLLAEKNTRGFIKSRNGNLEKLGRTPVSNVEKSSYQEHLKNTGESCVADNVKQNFSTNFLRFLLPALTVVKKVLNVKTIKERNSVLQPVLIVGYGKTKNVNCLEVSEEHEYFANGILVHNCDEELPEELVPELQARVSATDGYMIFGFTATMGQQFWKSVIEERTIWPHVWVKQISLFDCMKYTDGSLTMWTPERVQARIEQCTSKAEVLRRVYGKFVKDEGLRFPQFDRELHLAEYHPVPKEWEIYSGVDYGSGGEKGHPSAIVFAAVNLDYTQARIIRSWRGDKITTTAEDVVDMWIEMRATIPNDITATYYDYSAADLGIIAGRRSMPWSKADKSRDSGNAIIAGLLKSKAIKFYTPSDNSMIPNSFLEGFKFAQEFETLAVKIEKVRDIDHLMDALRYCLIKIPFKLRSRSDGYVIDGGSANKDIYYPAVSVRRDTEALKVWKDHDVIDAEGEFEFWNSMLEP